MIERRRYLDRIAAATGRAPVTSLLGPRQCGKTTLAREFASTRESTRFDLGSEADVRQLANPELVLGELRGLVVLDEIQILPRLFNVLRVLVDRPDADTRFLILGSASPTIVRGVSQSLAGRVEFIDMSGFDLEETGAADMRKLWRRGGFPRSWLADSEAESGAWRHGFIRTFLERDLPQLGVPVPAIAMRRFWNTLAHHHGQTANAANLGRSIGVSDKTARRYLDLLTGAWMVRQVQPWFENLGKRQVKAPKVYVRDTGLLHSLLGIANDRELLGHRCVGASWEGFAMEQILSALGQPTPWFWSAHGLGEIDLLLLLRGRRIGFEMKFSEAPQVRASTREIASALGLDHLFVVCPTRQAYPAARDITVLPATAIPSLPERIEGL
ncbi:MAG: ATP-binding protein [Acidobacteria bacterium]|nr:ATP-binding protein [Acidobacteriota bacterium]